MAEFDFAAFVFALNAVARLGYTSGGFKLEAARAHDGEIERSGG